MTRVEAIKILTGYMCGKIDPDSTELYHAIELAVDILESKPSFPSNLDDAAFVYGDRDGITAAQSYAMSIDFKAGAKWLAEQGVSLSHLIAWYIQSVDAHEPVWTKEHLEELVKDYILIPKN